MACPSSEKYFCVDVECVATGRRHDERAVCLVVVMDQHEKVVLRKTVKPEKSILSYLTPLTGVQEGDLDDGDSLSVVIAEVKKLLGPDVTLVGQGIKSDIKWLQLKKGEDYGDSVDLGDMFKTYNSAYRNYAFFSLSHEANTLLHSGMISDQHDPATDALASIQLFKKYYRNPQLLEAAKKKLLSTRAPASFAKRHNFRWEGVCMAAYRPDKCFCGAPTLKT